MKANDYQEPVRPTSNGGENAIYSAVPSRPLIKGLEDFLERFADSPPTWQTPPGLLSHLQVGLNHVG